MDLKPELDNLDNVPDKYKGLYEEVDGKFILDTDLSKMLDVSGLKNALRNERDTRQKLESKITSWEKLGKSADEILDLIKAEEQRAIDVANKKGEWETIKEQLISQHKSQITEKDAEINKHKSFMNEYLVDAAAMEAISELKGSTKLLLPHVKKNVTVVEENGSFSVRVLNNDGKPRLNSEGEFITIKDLVKEMRDQDDFSMAFEGVGKSGSGTPPESTGGGSTLSFKDMSQLSHREQVKAKTEYIEKHGLDAWTKFSSQS